VSAAEAVFTSYAEAKPVLAWLARELPPELAAPNQSKWDAWNRKNDRAIRTRLETGDLDSLVNLLLFGTSFTGQPRIRIEDMGAQARNGVLNARVADLVHGLAVPRGNERLAILRDLVLAKGVQFDSPEQRKQAGVFILQNLTRVLEEKRRFAERSTAAAAKSPDSTERILAERSGLFRDRGVSLDTGILADYSVDLALQRVKQQGGLGRVSRVAVIGPGLTFIDKDEAAAFDYFPPQTVQPFAALDSLLRLDLAGRDVSLTVLDISPLVLQHLQRARQQASKSIGYTIQLPQDAARSWPADLEDYWRRLGDRVGSAVEPIAVPATFSGLKTRAFTVTPEMVLRCQAANFDMVAQRMKIPTGERFDLVVATNVFLYYDRFQQALAIENVAPMMKPGGLLLANDELPESPESGVHRSGVSAVTDGRAGRDAMAFYRKQ